VTILLATNNDHKRQELSEILPDHQIRVPGDWNLDFAFEETADTFLMNAMGKARALRDLVPASRGQVIVVADDSGLCVDALDGAPGVYSARFGSPDDGATELPSPERNALLLKKLAGIDERRAHFVCCMVALFPGERYAVVQETFDGEIAHAPSGSGGFGYDPVFYLPERGLTVAELSTGEKHQISHRARAARALAPALSEMEANSAIG
jgi:XTP/dITP diphosphohydrolase